MLPCRCFSSSILSWGSTWSRCSWCSCFALSFHAASRHGRFLVFGTLYSSNSLTNSLHSCVCESSKSGTSGGKIFLGIREFPLRAERAQDRHPNSPRCPVANVTWEGQCPAPRLACRAQAESKGTQIQQRGPDAGKSFVNNYLA